MPLEILDLAFVLFGRRPALEGAKVAALAGFRIDLAGIEPILPRFELADHRVSPWFCRPQPLFISGCTGIFAKEVHICADSGAI